MRRPTVPLLLLELSYSWSTDSYVQPGNQTGLRKGAQPLNLTLGKSQEETISIMKPAENSSEINEWRIKPVPFRDPYAMMETNWWALLGALLFIGGIFAGLKVNALFAISIFGLVLALASIFLQGRITRRNWIKVLAQCTDKEWKSVLGAPGQRSGTRKTWVFQLLCEFELDGKRYTVTPGYWSTFISEGRLQKFLDKVISPDGKCQLWVNPKNPLQAELIANDIKDFLLHLHANHDRPY